MTWIAVCEFGNDPFIAPRLRRAKGNTSVTNLNRGSFVLEFELAADISHPLMLIDYNAVTDWNMKFGLRFVPGQGITLYLAYGNATFTVMTEVEPYDFTRTARLTYSWDYEGDQGLLTLETLEDGAVSQSQFRAPLPMPAHIVDRLMAQNLRTNCARQVRFFGFSDQIEPVGLQTTIAEGSPISTPHGFQPIEKLRVGDYVMTRDMGPSPIRWIGSRLVPTQGGFTPIRLSAPFFGLMHDVFVAPEQRILFDGDAVEYMLGEDEFLVEARHLVDGRRATYDASRTSISYYQILLDSHGLINVGGCLMESLFAADIGADPEMLQTTILRDMDATAVPEHHHVVRPLMDRSAAVTLRSMNI